MKVLMFVSNPFTNDPRVYNEALSLIGAGHKVTVIARDWEGCNNPFEDIDGINVIRITAPISPKRLLGAALVNGFSLLLWQRKAYKKAVKLNREIAYDVVHCHDLDTLLLGVKLKRRFKLRLVYDAHELYSYMMSRHFPRPFANMFWLFERLLLKNVDNIINVHEAQKIIYQLVTDKPVTVIMNCKPLQGYTYQPSQNKSCTLLYIGVLHKGRAVPLLIDAVKEIADVRCIIGGIGQPDYIQSLSRSVEEIDNVEFIGRVPFDQVIPMTREADVVYMMVNPDDRNNRIGLGNKQFEAMVCGRPIICTAGTYSGDLTLQTGAGLISEYDKDELKKVIIRLRDDIDLREKLGENALQAAIREYNWQFQEEKLLNLYNSFVS